MNGICEEREWGPRLTGFGNPFSTYISIDRQHAAIQVIRVIIPNERRKYEYYGDIEGVLKRICRVVSVPDSIRQDTSATANCVKWAPEYVNLTGHISEVDAVGRCVGIRCDAISGRMKLSLQAARSIA
jgi:hypothetical protein